MNNQKTPLSSWEAPPPPVYQTPEWESSARPPKRKLFGWPGFGNKPTAPASGNAARTDPAFNKDAEAPRPADASSFQAGSVAPRRTLRSRFDALLPPTRTYPLGLNRKRFLLFVILPLAILLLFVFPLALGLGLRARANASQNLPLPTNTGGVFEGELTYYSPSLGACGWYNSDSDAICAVSHLLWDAMQVGGNPNTNTLCGRKLRVRRDVEGVGPRTVDVTVVDRCTGCKPNDIDLSPSIFNQLAKEEQGRVVGTWAWL